MSKMVAKIRYGLYAEKLRERGLTQTRLAEIAGLAQQHLSFVVLGRRPNVSVTVALKIADALGVKVDELFELVPAEKAAPVPKVGAVDLAMAPAA